MVFQNSLDHLSDPESIALNQKTRNLFTEASSTCRIVTFLAFGQLMVLEEGVLVLLMDLAPDRPPMLRWVALHPCMYWKPQVDTVG